MGVVATRHSCGGGVAVLGVMRVGERPAQSQELFLGSPGRCRWRLACCFPGLVFFPFGQLLVVITCPMQFMHGEGVVLT